MNPEDVRMPAQPPEGDRDLRAALRASLPHGPDPGLEPLQARVLAQWRMRSAPAGQALSLGGGVMGLLRGFGHGPRLRVAAGLVLAVAIAGSVYLQRGDPALDELLEPDVLSLIMIGEL